ncbi:hypothetical protein HPB52_007378 [Rhipicephalus sanguineus]|uniref:Uncharacterized protein n=1 Tax=Rhipicephalus sanguineus TaxID=34632 RepID=A0A9D4PGI0_RHISA|nr:hypothetical protein HPB52_007378 [Rhipicephalus sanguineus]
MMVYCDYDYANYFGNDSNKRIGYLTIFMQACRRGDKHLVINCEGLSTAPTDGTTLQQALGFSPTDAPDGGGVATTKKRVRCPCSPTLPGLTTRTALPPVSDRVQHFLPWPSHVSRTLSSYLFLDSLLPSYPS